MQKKPATGARMIGTQLQDEIVKLQNQLALERGRCSLDRNANRSEGTYWKNAPHFCLAGKALMILTRTFTNESGSKAPLPASTFTLEVLTNEAGATWRRLFSPQACGGRVPPQATAEGRFLVGGGTKRTTQAL